MTVNCRRCEYAYRVCEVHSGVPSDGGASPLAWQCGAPAMPCPDGNPRSAINDPPKMARELTVMPEDEAGIATSRWLRHRQFGQRKNARSKIVATNTRFVSRDATKCISMSQSGHCGHLAICLLKLNNMAQMSRPIRPYSIKICGLCA